jgi:PAS domain S-box-containing protein
MDIPGIPSTCLRDTLGLRVDASPEEEAAALNQWLVTVADRYGRIVYASPEFAARLGYETFELEGFSELRFASTWHSERFFHDRWDTVAKGRKWSGAMICRTKGGALRHFETTFRPIWSDRREIIGYVALRLELKNASDEVVEQKYLCHHVLDQLKEGLALIDPSGGGMRFVFVNAAFARLTGYHPDTLVGSTPEILHGPQTDMEEVDRLRAALAVGEHFATELVLNRPNGTPFWASVSVSPTFDEQGELRHYVSLVDDVTVRRGQRQFRNFGDTMVEALEGGLPDSEIYREFLGTLQEALCGVSFALYTRLPTGLTLCLEASAGAFEAQVPESIAWTGRHSWSECARGKRRIFAVGEALDWEYCPAPLKAAWRETFPDPWSGWFGLGLDLAAQPTCLLWVHLTGRSRLGEAERELLEDAIRRLQELQHRLGARALRLSVSRKLQQSQKMEAIGTLASGIAHDFNNILGGMFGFLHLAREDVGTGHPAEEWLKQIDSACIRARDLIQQVLTFSRTEAGSLGSVNPLSMVKDAIRLIRASLPSSVEIELHLPNKSLPQIEADPTRIQLALLNLCTNSWQAMPKGQGTIDLRLVEQERNGKPWLGLVVEDNGRGIAPENLERIREPFYSTHASDEVRGTGLGLAVVQGIIEAHSGLMEVESAEGTGSTFTLWFPALAEHSSSATTATPTMPRGNGERIFFLDDEVAITTWSRLILQRMGYGVETCNDPEIALAMLERQLSEVDLVIVDLTMPGYSGLEVIERLQKWRADLPIILISGRGAILDERELGSARPRMILQKPVGMEDLGKALQEVFGRAAE